MGNRKPKRRGRDPRSPAQRVADAEKVAKALELRVSGATFVQIAKALGYRGKQGAFKAVARGMAALTSGPAQANRDAELERLQLEETRLDRVYLGLVNTGAFKGDPDAATLALRVTQQRLRVLERRSKYLGLDAAEKVEISGAVNLDYAAMTDDELNRIRALRPR
jgi:hypothetical protein